MNTTFYKTVTPYPTLRRGNYDNYNIDKDDKYTFQSRFSRLYDPDSLSKKIFLNEFLGTFLFLLVILIATDKNRSSENKEDNRIQCPAAIIGVGLTMSILCFGKDTGGYFNPCVRLYDSRLDKFMVYLLPQLLGGAFALMVFLFCFSPSQSFNDVYKKSKKSSFHVDFKDTKIWKALLAEMIGTCFFVFAIGMIVHNTETNMKPFLIGLVLYVLISSLGQYSGGHFNPIVSLVFYAKSLFHKDQHSVYLLYILFQVFGVGLAFFLQYLSTKASTTD